MRPRRSNRQRSLRHKVLWLFAILAVAPFLIASLVQYRQAEADGARSVVAVADMIASRTMSEARRIRGESAMDAEHLIAAAADGVAEAWVPLSPNSLQSIRVFDPDGTERHAWTRESPPLAASCNGPGSTVAFQFTVSLPGDERSGEPKSTWTAEVVPDLSEAVASHWTDRRLTEDAHLQLSDGAGGFLTSAGCTRYVDPEAFVAGGGATLGLDGDDVYRSRLAMGAVPWHVDAFLTPAALGIRDGTARWFFAVAVVAGLIATILFGMFLAGMTRSLEQIALAADRIGDGDFTPWLPPPGDDEAGRLSYAIGMMSDRLREMLDSVKRSGQMAAVGEMASYVAHEIRNPLNSLRLNLQSVERSARKGILDDDDMESLEISLREVTRLDRVVSGVLKFTRPTPTDIDLTSLHGVILEAVALLGEEMDRRSVDPTLELTAEEDWIRGDAQRIEAALINLLLNAIEAMPDGGSVVITTRNVEQAGDAAVELLITDSGPGIPAEVRERVFDPFFTTKSTGSGLGLAVVMRTVEEHGGIIELEEPTVLHRGATFRVVFPVLRQVAEQPAPRRWRIPVQAARTFLQWRNRPRESESTHAMHGQDTPK